MHLSMNQKKIRKYYIDSVSANIIYIKRAYLDQLGMGKVFKKNFKYSFEICNTEQLSTHNM